MDGDPSNSNSFDTLKKYLRYKKSKLDGKNVELRLAHGSNLVKGSSPRKIDSKEFLQPPQSNRIATVELNTDMAKYASE